MILTKEVIIEWEQSFDIYQEIINSNNIQSVEKLFSSFTPHPLTLYGKVDMCLVFDNKKILNESMAQVLDFVKKPFPSIYFQEPFNDPIGEIMLKPLIQYPIIINNNLNLQNSINWILVGYAFLYQCYKELGNAAYDSLRTIGIAIEENSDDYSFLIFSKYLNRSNYNQDYVKFLVFCYINSALGHKEHKNDIEEFENLIDRASFYSNELQKIEPLKDISIFIDEGEEIANLLFEKIIHDIKSNQINLSTLLPVKI